MTREIPRVLLAASGSASSRRATEIAADLATTFNAQLTILHVAVPITWRVGRLAPTLPITPRLEDPLTNPVLLDARRVAWARGTSAKTLLIEGDTARVIVAVAGELAPTCSSSAATRVFCRASFPRTPVGGFAPTHPARCCP